MLFAYVLIHLTQVTVEFSPYLQRENAPGTGASTPGTADLRSKEM